MFHLKLVHGFLKADQRKVNGAEKISPGSKDFKLFEFDERITKESFNR